jgi:hypothetical protein
VAGFTFKLELADGTPADPPEHLTAVPNWRAGDTIPVRPGRTVRVVETRLDEATDGEPVPTLVVEASS